MLYPLWLKTYPNQKLWIDSSIRQNWKRLPPHSTMARQLGIWQNTNRVVIPSARQSNKQNARFEDNTVPPTRLATKVCGLSFPVADMSKTFKRVNPHKAAGSDGIPSRVLRACSDQLTVSTLKTYQIIVFE